VIAEKRIEPRIKIKLNQNINNIMLRKENWNFPVLYLIN